MRTTQLITISLPPLLAKQSEKIAKQKSMTRSELIRTALREYLETQSAKTALEIYKKEKSEKKLKVLKGSLTSLIG